MSITFPDPSFSPWTGPNGVTYEWDNKGYWEASGVSLTDTYLSKVNNDNAAGAITFEDTTTHEGGVEVTGGQGAVSDGLMSTGANNISLISSNETAGNNTLDLHSDFAAALVLDVKNGTVGRADQSTCYGFQVKNPNTLSTSRADQAYFGITSGVNITSPVANAYGFFGDCSDATGVTGIAASYYANANTSNTKAFNFYAAGDAPNFFQGNVLVNATNSEPGLNNTEVGIVLNNTNTTGATIFASRADNIAMCMNRNSSGIVGQYRINGDVRGEVVVSSGGCNWNSRTSFSTRDEVPEYTGAASVISQLKAGRDGFSAEDIQAYLPGDWVHQSEGEVMFDNTRLIPILTKALQEALARIEALENA